MCRPNKIRKEKPRIGKWGNQEGETETPMAKVERKKLELGLQNMYRTSSKYAVFIRIVRPIIHIIRFTVPYLYVYVYLCI
jgi:hypothetical protein